MSGVLYYKREEEYSNFKAEWEKTRMQTYFLIAVQMPKKNSFSYERFKKDMWPFSWEVKKAATKEELEEGMMTLDDWNKLLNKPVVSVDKGFPTVR